MSKNTTVYSIVVDSLEASAVQGAAHVLFRGLFHGGSAHPPDTPLRVPTEVSEDLAGSRERQLWLRTFRDLFEHSHALQAQIDNISAAKERHAMRVSQAAKEEEEQRGVISLYQNAVRGARKALLSQIPQLDGTADKEYNDLSRALLVSSQRLSNRERTLEGIQTKIISLRQQLEDEGAKRALTHLKLLSRSGDGYGFRGTSTTSRTIGRTAAASTVIATPLALRASPRESLPLCQTSCVPNTPGSDPRRGRGVSPRAIEERNQSSLSTPKRVVSSILPRAHSQTSASRAPSRTRRVGSPSPKRTASPSVYHSLTSARRIHMARERRENKN